MNFFDKKVLDKLQSEYPLKKGCTKECRFVTRTVALSRQEVLAKIEELQKAYGFGKETRGFMLGRSSVLADLRSFLQEGEEK